MGPGLTVLIACHDLMPRSNLETTLRHMGLETRTLHATADVAMAIDAARPAAVIIDLALGEAAWRRVVAAARACDPPLPLLAFGAHVDREARRTCRRVRPGRRQFAPRPRPAGADAAPAGGARPCDHRQ